MVLVSNEWLNNKDDGSQKPNPASPTTSPAPSQSAAALSNRVNAGSLAGGETTASTTVKRKKSQQNNTNMDTMKKLEPDQLFQLMEREKHELESEDAINNEEEEAMLENQENNNIQLCCDSNTSTLQSASCPDRRTTSPQQMLHMAMNSVLNANNANSVGVGVPSTASLFNSLSALREPPAAQDCGTLLIAPGPANTDLEASTGTGEAKIVLHCEAKSHKFETRSILLQPNQECKVGRLIAKSKASENNAIFDCKVLSRNHAMLWYTADGRFWVKDTKSSNGTFINDNKLGNDPAELHYGDSVKFGVEVIENSRQEVHGCIIARVTLFLPDGREAISIESEQMLLLTGPNRISFDEIQRLNSFLQEAAQREKTLKAKLSSLQGVLDSTRKNSAMCWQSMITEDQLIHKINLLEKKLQMMEKNVPENTLRNEIVKMLEDKTTYQLTAKEALRKVYQERCDAMQMYSKMEMAYATTENECGILRAQIVTSKQALQDYDARIEALQKEFVEYKQESLRQQKEAKDQEEHNLGELKEQLVTQDREMDELRLQVSHLQRTIAEHDSEQKLLEQNVLEQLDSVIPDDDDERNDDEDDNDDNHATSSEENSDVPEKDGCIKWTDKLKKGKKSKLNEVDLKNKVIRKSSVLKLLKNSDLNKGEGGSALLRAIFNDNDDDDSQSSFVPAELSAGIKRDAADETASDEFIHNSPKHMQLNGTNETSEIELSEVHKLQSQETIVCHEKEDNFLPDLPTHQAIEMLQVECDMYKEKTARLTGDIHSMQEQIEQLKNQLELEIECNAKLRSLEDQSEKLIEKQQRMSSGQDGTEETWNDDIATMNSLQMEREEELIVYKERLEQLEISNMQLRTEISNLRLNQQQHLQTGNKQILLQRVLPIGCVVFAALLCYFISNRI
ncbi:sarcolemmal membrane-associated protein [Drosophila kikkawai]|uniref:Sarcolemmal membrane-associated protein n=1 Tax=Drosophila kikkawai TaxID=30033 RepID=A0A6P4IL38_DROKI|nr:sarcolemmal membrane-associated protein [Drosophila kikkawai]XP_017029140.1 sarcolemmal membrane-associated protein [Drosophila kikkawai]